MSTTLQKWVDKKTTIQEIIDGFIRDGYVLAGLMFRDKKTGTFQPYIFEKQGVVVS